MIQLYVAGRSPILTISLCPQMGIAHFPVWESGFVSQPPFSSRSSLFSPVSTVSVALRTLYEYMPHSPFLIMRVSGCSLLRPPGRFLGTFAAAVVAAHLVLWLTGNLINQAGPLLHLARPPIVQVATHPQDYCIIIKAVSPLHKTESTSPNMTNRARIS